MPDPATRAQNFSAAGVVAESVRPGPERSQTSASTSLVLVRAGKGVGFLLHNKHNKKELPRLTRRHREHGRPPSHRVESAIRNQANSAERGRGGDEFASPVLLIRF